MFLTVVAITIWFLLGIFLGILFKDNILKFFSKKQPAIKCDAGKPRYNYSLNFGDFKLPVSEDDFNAVQKTQEDIYEYGFFVSHTLPDYLNLYNFKIQDERNLK